MTSVLHPAPCTTEHPAWCDQLSCEPSTRDGLPTSWAHRSAPQHVKLSANTVTFRLAQLDEEGDQPQPRDLEVEVAISGMTFDSPHGSSTTFTVDEMEKLAYTFLDWTSRSIGWRRGMQADLDAATDNGI